MNLNFFRTQRAVRVWDWTSIKMLEGVSERRGLYNVCQQIFEYTIYGFAVDRKSCNKFYWGLYAQLVELGPFADTSLRQLLLHKIH